MTDSRAVSKTDYQLFKNLANTAKVDFNGVRENGGAMLFEIPPDDVPHEEEEDQQEQQQPPSNERGKSHNHQHRAASHQSDRSSSSQSNHSNHNRSRSQISEVLGTLSPKVVPPPMGPQPLMVQPPISEKRPNVVGQYVRRPSALQQSALQQSRPMIQQQHQQPGSMIPPYYMRKSVFEQAVENELQPRAPSRVNLVGTWATAPGQSSGLSSAPSNDLIQQQQQQYLQLQQQYYQLQQQIQQAQQQQQIPPQYHTSVVPPPMPIYTNVVRAPSTASEQQGGNNGQQQDDAETKHQKRKYLLELEKLRLQGIHLTQKYSMKSDLVDIRFEYESHQANKDMISHINFWRTSLCGAFLLIETINRNVGPILELNGWAKHMITNINNFDRVLERFYHMYARKGQMSPFAEFGWLVIGSMLMWHVQEKYFGGIPIVSMFNSNNSNSMMGMMSGLAQQQQQPQQQQAQQTSSPTQGGGLLSSIGTMLSAFAGNVGANPAPNLSIQQQRPQQPSVGQQRAASVVQQPIQQPIQQQLRPSSRQQLQQQQQQQQVQQQQVRRKSMRRPSAYLRDDNTAAAATTGVPVTQSVDAQQSINPVATQPVIPRRVPTSIRRMPAIEQMDRPRLKPQVAVTQPQSQQQSQQQHAPSHDESNMEDDEEDQENDEEDVDE